MLAKHTNRFTAELAKDRREINDLEEMEVPRV